MKLCLYRDEKNEWRWHLRALNGKIVADSAESYKRRGAMINTLHKIFPAYWIASAKEEELKAPPKGPTRDRFQAA